MHRFDRGITHDLTVYATVVTALLATVFVLSGVLSAPLERTFLVVFGVYALAGVGLKPWWFWEHVDGWFLRSLLGDRGAQLGFVLAGLVLLYCGLFAELPSIG